MTQELGTALREYLVSAGRLDSVELGGEPREAPRSGDPEGVAATVREHGTVLARTVRRVRRSNRRFALLLVVLLLAVFAVAFYLALASGGLTGISVAAGSGALATLLAVIAALGRLWRERSMMDLLTAMLEESSTERSADLIEAVYWTAFSGRRR